MRRLTAVAIAVLGAALAFAWSDADFSVTLHSASISWSGRMLWCPAVKVDNGQAVQQ